MNHLAAKALCFFSLKGSYSRRINIQYRLVYQVDAVPFEENGILYQGWVKVIRMWTHYE